MKLNGFFITGTDTGVGKTVISAALMIALRRQEKVCYWKPIQTGIEADNDTLTVSLLANCREEEIHDVGFRLERPLSPHLSAKLSGTEITVEKTLQFIKDQEAGKFWIVEGAGGVLVPLNNTEMITDLMKALRLPVILVARSGLGTINHTLLTLEALRSRDLKILGVILNGEPNRENCQAIKHFGKVKVLAEVPRFETLSSSNLRTWAQGRLDTSSF